MQFSLAAEQSKFKIAWRKMDEGRMEVYDRASDSFFIHNFDPKDRTDEKAYTIIRRPGRGNKGKDDWTACTNEYCHKLIEEFKAKQEGRDIEIKKPWEKACAQTDARRAFRVDEVGRPYMFRDHMGNTFHVTNGGATLARLTGPFRAYDGWEPLPKDSPFALIDMTVSHNYTLSDGKPSLQKKSPPAYTNPDAPRSKVLDVTITTAGETIKALKESLQYISDEPTKLEIVKEMLALSKSLSWHLREDRNKW